MQVVAARTTERDGYTAVQLKWGKAKVKNVSELYQRPLCHREGRAEAEARGIPRCGRRAAGSRARLCRPRISSSDRRSTSAALPRARVSPARMKRWNFAGLEASHGVSVIHRRTVRRVTVRTRARPSRTRRWPAISADRMTTLNLEVAAVDADEGLLMIKGAVPGGGRLRPGARCDQGGASGRCAFPAALLDGSAGCGEQEDADRDRHPRQGAPALPISPTRSSVQNRGQDGARRGLASCRSAAPGPHKVKGMAEVSGHNEEAIQARRAPATLVRAPSARPSSVRAAWCTDRWFAATDTACLRRSAGSA